MKKSNVTRWIPLIIIVIAAALILYFRLYEYLTLDSLSKHHMQLQAWTQQHYLLVMLAFMAIYIAATALSIPGVLILTIAGGFLFGYVFGTLFVVFSATLGACIIFLAVKTALGDWLASKASGWVAKMEHGFQQNAVSYLLFLRLVPLFPFFVVNIVPALLGIRLRTFFATTLFGIIPGTFVYVSIGVGLGAIIESGASPDFGVIFKPQILIPIVGLAILALVPIVYKKIKAKKSAK